MTLRCLLSHDWQHTPTEDYDWMSSYSTFTCDACGEVKVDLHPTAETGKDAEREQYDAAKQVATRYSFRVALNNVDIDRTEYERAQDAISLYKERHYPV